MILFWYHFRGLFFDKHLKFIQLNTEFVPFTKHNLSYLLKDAYDPAFHEHIYSLPEITSGEVKSGSRSDLPEVRVTYSTKQGFKDAAKVLGLMDDFKAGVERMAYRGVVSCSFQGQRVHLSPPADWKAYDPTWS